MRTFALWTIAAMAVAMTTTGCSDAPEEATASPLRRVEVYRVAPPNPTIRRSFSGLVRATEGVELGFETGGRIIELAAEDGGRYEAGAPLARLDATGFRADLNNAQAQFAAADADLQRTLRLYENANASRSQLDAAMAARETAKANLDIALKLMADTTLRMPYRGSIGRVLTDKQQVVTAGQSVLTIRGERGLQIEIGVPARFIDDLKVGQPAIISVGPLPDLEEVGSVTEISPQISENTTYLVTVAFADPDPSVLEGMDGEAILELPNPAGAVLTVPTVCVATSGRDEQFVWVAVQSGKTPEGKVVATLERRTVRVGQLHDGSRIEVLAGLEPGTLVVSRGVHRVDEGQEVLLDTMPGI